MFLLAACIRWLPPIAKRSPSPLITATFNLGLAIFTPVANAIARPCVVWKASDFIYPEALPAQPIPETTTSLSMSKSKSFRAWAKEFSNIPSPHPSHQMWGILSVLKYSVSGCSCMTLLIYKTPLLRIKFHLAYEALLQVLEEKLQGSVSQTSLLLLPTDHNSSQVR